MFSRREDLEVDSAGTNHDAENPLTAELVAWADLIFVMEKAHRGKLRRRFRVALAGKRVICLDIPGDYAFMQPELVQLLETKVSRHLPAIYAAARAERHLLTGLPSPARIRPHDEWMFGVGGGGGGQC